MTLFSTSFNDLAVLPLKHTCLAKPAGVSPALHWINVPVVTVSVVVMFHDLERWLSS